MAALLAFFRSVSKFLIELSICFNVFWIVSIDTREAQSTWITSSTNLKCGFDSTRIIDYATWTFFRYAAALSFFLNM
jgi:hypothetical protein